MSRIVVCGCGAVSPAGWGVAPLRAALARGEPIPNKSLARPGKSEPFQSRAVMPLSPRPGFASHARLRRTSPIVHYTVAAALEALGPEPAKLDRSRLGIIYCGMIGCVGYSRRFYDETLKDPATASPMVFPETVFNAPASHLAAFLGSTAINYTLVGDPGTFLQGLALATDWLLSERVEGCLVVGAEELDWLVSEAYRLFDRKGVVSEGAGALLLRRDTAPGPGVELRAITRPYCFSKNQSRAEAAARARADLSGGAPQELLCDGLQGVARLDEAERVAWQDWRGPRLSPKVICGEAFMAAAAWQCVAAVDALFQEQHPAATVSVVGCNQQAIAAQFARTRED